MDKKVQPRLVSILLALLILAPGMGYTKTAEDALLLDLKKFQWEILNSETVPCPSFKCHLTWGAVSIAIGDVGGYARRVKKKGMSEYAKLTRINQNFDKVENLELLAPAMPIRFSDRFTIPFENSFPVGRADAKNFGVDSRIFIKIFVNDNETNVIFDSGATLTLPGGSQAAESLDLHNIATKNTSGLGKVEENLLATAKNVSVGAVSINNLMVKKKEGLPLGDINAVGLLGYDLLLRFDKVTVDFKKKTIKFNPESVGDSHCAPMEMALDKNWLPAGLTVDILLDNVPFKARIDTGANVDVAVHGKNIMSSKTAKPSPVFAIDSGGNASPLEEFDSNVSLNRDVTKHKVLRSPFTHDDFQVTLGVKFFAGRSFTFDFRNQRFCLD